MNLDAVIDNFSDHPERVMSLVHKIEKLILKLRNEGYMVKANECFWAIPERITVIHNGNWNGAGYLSGVKNDFFIFCRSLGIESLFEPNLGFPRTV
ncbi:MAG TPA: hypothetical protein VI564_06795 [Candidatus Nanoarchaeia archaeon]|nr:hypothetical protein [Candidatus Nanoarchaeia archaeon]